MWPHKFIAIAQIMRSSNLLPFLIDLVHEMEMSAVFGFGEFSRDYFWDTLQGHGGVLMELNCLRQTVSPPNLGKVINVELLSEELRKRISYCKTVWDMNLSEKPCESLM